MEKRVLTAVVLLSLFMAIVSCSKDGEPGPAGAPGTQGVPGPAGVPGSQIYNGSGIPATTLGNTGDYYINKDNAELYGPKSTTGWGTAVSLKGDSGTPGAEGTPGSKMLAGENAPAATVGAVGDFYFDNTNAVMYGPKTESGWGSGTPLRIAQVISYVVSRPSLLVWDENHRINISNLAVPMPRDIIQNGIVLGYIVIRGRESTDVWQSIPGHVWVRLATTQHYFISMTWNTSARRIDAYNADGSSLASDQNPPVPDKIKIILIPADQVNTVARKGGVDYSNYEEVKERFNLRD